MERENDNRTLRERIADEFRLIEAASGVVCDPPSTAVLDGFPLVMVYAPSQKWRNAYSPEEALFAGTMFAELDLPLEAVRKKGGAK
ncbi:MAG: spore coat associated protein CotJA [Clostridiales bacterium]|nr:spore coat associated protein CotJA [Clostridiales bacterium]